MKLFFITLTSLLILSLNTQAQHAYQEANNIIVTQNGKIIQAALTGGYNTAQFGEIDLDLDGIKDLVVYDRFLGQVRPYINKGIPDSVSYAYDFQYSHLFPEMDEFLLIADYNNDGKNDLFVGGTALTLYENVSTSATGLVFQYVDVLKSRYNLSSPNRIAIGQAETNLPGLYDIDGDNDLDVFTNEDFPTVSYHRNLSIDQNSDYAPIYDRRSQCWGLFFEGPNEIQTKQDSIYRDSCYSFLNRGERVKFKNGSTHYNNKHLGSGGGLTITPIDYDGNSSTDLIIADAGVKHLKVLLNADSVTPYTDSRIYKVLNSFPDYDIPVDILFPAAYILDVNNDGKKDMLVASNQENVGVPPFSSDNISYYKNIATDGNFNFQFQTDQFLKDQTLDFGRTSKPVFYDYNKDGLKDILIGNGGYLSPSSDSIFIGQLALLENTGDSLRPKFELISTNYLDIPSIDFGFNDTLFANISPTVGDLDNDGDDDLLITHVNGNVYLFEDTAASGSDAEFKFHAEPFQAIGNLDIRLIATRLYDIDNNGLLDLIVNSLNHIEFFPNFGTASNPLFHISVDSIYWIGGDTMRYSFSDTPNFNLFHLGDSVEINNGIKKDNNSKIPLSIVRIDSANNFIDCINHIEQGVGSNKFDELNTSAKLTYFNRNWSFEKSKYDITLENIFLYRDKDKNQVILGTKDGNNFFHEDFTDSLESVDTIIQLKTNFMVNYGENAFIDGADINNDNFIDLVVGTNTGGIKILYGEESVGLNELLSNSKNRDKKHFQIYPNPAKTYLNLELNNKNSSLSKIEIRSISGQLILANNLMQNRLSIPIENLPNGVYVISVRNEHFYQLKKFVVQH